MSGDAAHIGEEKSSWSSALKLQEFNGESILSNGDIFIGSWLGNFLEGKGKYLWSNGCMYEGERGKEYKCGKGRISWPSGSTYEGNFAGGYLHGMGTYTGVHGSTYKGNWERSKKHGFGTKWYGNGDVYEGLWKNGVPHGTGRYIWKIGSEYIGNWKNGAMSGRGIQIWANHDTFNGQWLGGLEHGRGIYRFADGSIHIGTWNTGLKDGKFLLHPPGSIYMGKTSSFPDFGSRIDHAVSKNELLPTSYVPESELSQEILARWYSRDQIGLCEAFIERMEPLERFLFPWENGVLKIETDDRCSKSEPEFLMFLVMEREYAHGVLINEVLNGMGKSDSLKFSKKLHNYPTENIKGPRKSICRGDRSYDLMLRLQLGIRFSVGRINSESERDLFPVDFGPKARIWKTFPRKGSQSTPPHQSANFKWKDYCPMVFRHLRKIFRIDAANYMTSICGNNGLRELYSSGKSGSFFYVSQDDGFIIKTLRKPEVKVLLGMLPNYYYHVCTNQSTLITKLFGLYQVKSAIGQTVHFVVMGNTFCTELQTHFKFDLKGSSQGRSIDNLDIDETTTMKDLDLGYVFYLDTTWRDILLRQIESDCKFLESERIMDYSLLLGLHFREPQFPTILSSTHSMSQLAPGPRSFNNEMSELGIHSDNDEARLRSLAQTSAVKVPMMDDGEDLMQASDERLCIQLGANMPARAVCRPLRKETSFAEEQNSQVYDVLLCFGIIDILQEYNIGKKLEHTFKSLQFDSLSISAVHPNLYSKRFQKSMHRIFLEENLPLCIQNE